jgi:hypothetical protein
VNKSHAEFSLTFSISAFADDAGGSGLDKPRNRSSCSHTVGVAAAGTIERSLVELFVPVALLFVIMPGLLYLVGWAAKRFSERRRPGSAFPPTRKS